MYTKPPTHIHDMLNVSLPKNYWLFLRCVTLERNKDHSKKIFLKKCVKKWLFSVFANI